MKATKIFSLALALILTLGALALTSCTDSKQFTVGICQYDAHPALDAATQGFKDAIVAALGEDAVKFDDQNAAGSGDTCSTIVSTFVTKNVDLIMANATPALAAAQNATSDIPILGTSITEYGVALGIDNFSGTVGTNISGTSDLAPLDQQAQMIIDLVPTAKTVGMLYCSAEPNSEYQVKKVTEYLSGKGITCKDFAFSGADDVQIIAANAASNCDALYIPTDNTAATYAEAIHGVVADSKLPIIAGEEGICGACGIATLSIDYYDLGYATGEMAVKILKGEANVAEMAIEYTPADKIKKKYNKAICEDLGIDTAALEAKGFTAIQ